MASPVLRMQLARRTTHGNTASSIDLKQQLHPSMDSAQSVRIDVERIDLLRAALERAGLDLLICGSATDVLLLSGYWPIMSTSVAVMTRGGKVHLLVPEDEADLASETSAAEITAYKPESLSKLTNPVESLRQPLGALLRAAGESRANVGIRRWNSVQPSAYVVSNDFHESLQALIIEIDASAKVCAADDLLESQKSVKTAAELLQMERAATIASNGFAVAQESIAVGRTEAEVASEIQAAFDRTSDIHGAHRSYGYFFCMSGPNSATAAAAYARTRQRKIEDGDLVMIHANTCADGFWTDITRTYTAGFDVQRHREMRSSIMEARAAALKLIAPHVAASAVDHGARSVMEAHDFGSAFKHATGHGVGYAAANANALPRIHPLSPDMLAAGMTFNVEPAAYFDGYGGMRHCDVVAVTNNGVKVLTDF